jgi:hypothetical protein
MFFVAAALVIFAGCSILQDNKNSVPLARSYADTAICSSTSRSISWSQPRWQ